MFLVSQRVVTPGGEGINAFLHGHGPRPDWVWELPAGIPDEDPGQVADQILQVTGQGRVRSFLDIAAPDGTSAHQLQWAHDAIVALGNVGAQFPITVVSGPMFVRYNVELPLRADWHGELHTLLEAALALVPAASGAV
jgi:hypothetical protein